MRLNWWRGTLPLQQILSAKTTDLQHYRVTKAGYGQNLEENLRELHQQLLQMSYRPKAVRRVEIPKEDGTCRPLGISCGCVANTFY